MDNLDGLVARCGKCGEDIGAGRTHCDQCAIEMAEEGIPDFEETPQIPEGPNRRKKRRLLQGLFLLACLAAIAVQMPRLIDAFQETRPIRGGVYDSDVVADRCIHNLWRISRILQDGDLPDADIVCPASGKRYPIVGAGRAAGARCPNPEIHGFLEISVSAKSPRPEVRR